MWLSFLEKGDLNLGLPSYWLDTFFVKIADWTWCTCASIFTMLKCPLRYLHLNGFDFLGRGVALSTALKISHTHRIWVLAKSELWLRLRLFGFVLIVLYNQPLTAVSLLFDTWEVVVLRGTNWTVISPAVHVRCAAYLLVLYWNVPWLWIWLYLTFPGPF